jgi:hypothetical protein
VRRALVDLIEKVAENLILAERERIRTFDTVPVCRIIIQYGALNHSATSPSGSIATTTLYVLLNSACGVDQPNENPQPGGGWGSCQTTEPVSGSKTGNAKNASRFLLECERPRKPHRERWPGGATGPSLGATIRIEARLTRRSHGGYLQYREQHEKRADADSEPLTGVSHEAFRRGHGSRISTG